MWSPADVIAKTRAPGERRPAKKRSCTQYTKELAITSSVISSWALAIEPSLVSAKKGFNVPNASECRTTETRASGGSPPHFSAIAAPTPPPRWVPRASLLRVLVPVWVEPAGSWLAEPDEARYAEIPREMLASADFVTPLLNGVPYFEKPPLLYWVNAASLRLFGETPWAV